MPCQHLVPTPILVRILLVDSFHTAPFGGAVFLPSAVIPLGGKIDANAQSIYQKENEDKLKMLAQLPDSCEASADCLEKQRAIFEKYNVFSPAMIDGIINKLRSYKDRTLRQDIGDNQDEMLKLVYRYFHCG